MPSFIREALAWCKLSSLAAVLFSNCYCCRTALVWQLAFVDGTRFWHVQLVFAALVYFCVCACKVAVLYNTATCRAHAPSRLFLSYPLT